MMMIYTKGHQIVAEGRKYNYLLNNPIDNKSPMPYRSQKERSIIGKNVACLNSLQHILKARKHNKQAKISFPRAKTPSTRN